MGWVRKVQVKLDIVILGEETGIDDYEVLYVSSVIMIAMVCLIRTGLFLVKLTNVPLPDWRPTITTVSSLLLKSIIINYKPCFKSFIHIINLSKIAVTKAVYWLFMVLAWAVAGRYTNGTMRVSYWKGYSSFIKLVYDPVRIRQIIAQA